MNEHVCTACNEVHDPITDRSLGMVCGRCGKHTGNNTQGHYWGFCKVLAAQGIPFPKSVRGLHFCCPDGCELETKS